jgi:uncharacterized protein YbaR (Trm112 family)
MKNNFQCPHCKGYLNVGDKVIVTARASNGFSGLMLLHAELGNYLVEHHEGFTVEEGESVELKCPVCNKSLTSEKSDELAHILMEGEERRIFDVYFSKIKGVKSTYQIVGDHIEYYGDDSEKYIDFFNLSQLT